MTSRKIFLAVACVLALTGAAFGAGRHTKSEKPLSISQGQEVDLADFLVTGLITVFNFTSEYCPPCRPYADPLLKLHEQRGGLAVVKVDINRPEYHEIDWQSPVSLQYAMADKGLPYFMIYGPDGQVFAEGREARLLVNQWIQALE